MDQFYEQWKEINSPTLLESASHAKHYTITCCQDTDAWGYTELLPTSNWQLIARGLCCRALKQFLLSQLEDLFCLRIPSLPDPPRRVQFSFFYAPGSWHVPPAGPPLPLVQPDDCSPTGLELSKVRDCVSSTPCPRWAICFLTHSRHSANVNCLEF